MTHQAEEAAYDVIRRHNYTPPIDVRRVANDLGIEVQEQDLEPQISGLLVRNGSRAIIAINERHHRNRQRFSIAHEIGHFCLHQTQPVFIDAAPVAFHRDEVSSTGLDPLERQANAFAAALLMPEDSIRTLVNGEPVDAFDEIALQRLAAHFEVSTQALTIRLINLRLLASW